MVPMLKRGLCNGQESGPEGLVFRHRLSLRCETASFLFGIFVPVDASLWHGLHELRVNGSTFATRKGQVPSDSTRRRIGTGAAFSLGLRSQCQLCIVVENREI